MADLLAWLETHGELLRVAGLLSIVTFVGSLIALPLFVAALPADYFAGPEAPPTRFASLHPLARAFLSLAKNVLGALILLAGLAMLVLPGQGVLTLLAGLVLLNFPGKRRLELALFRRKRIQRGLNWIRSRAGRVPLELPRDP